MHYAVYQNYVECVNLLLVRGADVDAVDDIGYSALHLCAERGYMDTLLLLLQHGASVRFTDRRRSSTVRLSLSVSRVKRISAGLEQRRLPGQSSQNDDS